jgi:predicted oxidoreductase
MQALEHDRRENDFLGLEAGLERGLVLGRKTEIGGRHGDGIGQRSGPAFILQVPGIFAITIMSLIDLCGELSLSRFVYGWWRLTGWGMTRADIQRRIEDCLALGITSHDHADIYGGYQCEALFGAALKAAPALREQIQLVSKCGIKLVSEARPQHRRRIYDTTTGHILGSVEQSLRNLATDHLDLLLIHRPDPLMDADAVAAAFYRLRNAGKVRAFGVSNFTPAQFALLQSRLDFPLVTNQIEISLLAHQALQDGSLDQAQALRRPPMAWSPLAGGRLFDEHAPLILRETIRQLAAAREVSADQIALAWLLAHPARILPVLGSQSLKRIESAVQSLVLPLGREAWFELYEAAGGKLP